ncbi:ribosome-associated translation inhibitor RaiA [Candidatus Saccharibacteria bacterium]|nr:ribosome-associated translation inhibitor RaiA [Candidatus Saccharibacteria bacterium]
MIRQIDITGINLDLGDDFKRYATRKIGRLERLIPRQNRGDNRAEIRVKEVNESHGNKYRVEVILHLPDEQISVQDSTMNMFAALDIVEEKLKNCLHKYKDKHSNRPRIQGGGIFGRFKRQREQSDSGVGTEMAEVE